MRAQITYLSQPIIEALLRQLDDGDFSYTPVCSGHLGGKVDGISTEDCVTLLVATKLLDLWGV